MDFITTTQQPNFITRFLFTGFQWLLLSLLLITAINLKDPHFLPFRQLETILLLIISGGGIAFYLGKPDGIKRTIALIILLVSVALILLGEFSFRYHKYVVINGIDGNTLPLGEHFIVGYDNLDELRPLISKGLIAGIFVTQHNAEGKSIQNLHDEIREFQKIRKKAGLPPLIVTTDQEGGIVSRLSPPLIRMPSLASTLNGNPSKAEQLIKAEVYGQEQGQMLANIGITVNFSPIVDLKSNRAENRLDFHSLINQRAISSDPTLTTEVAQAYIRGLKSQGVKATLKHFPGLGRVTNDTHHFSAMLETSVAELDAQDWIPFKKIITTNSNVLIMLSHVTLTEFDRENPVSFSKNVVQSIIRDTWKHEGVLITDDLTMGAAYNHGLCDATIKALNAGVDLLLVSYDYEKFFDAMYCASQAFKSGQLAKNMMNTSHDRLIHLFQ